MIVLSHNDPDGMSAANIWYSKYPDATYIEMDYDREIPWDKISKNEAVIILDFSLQKPGEWEKLWKITHEIIWIDHHGTVISNAPKFTKKFDGIRDVNACGGLLTWFFLYPDKNAPMNLRIIDSWDRWIHNDNQGILNFMSGLKIIDDSLGSQDWYNLLFGSFIVQRNKAKEIIKNGKIIRKYDQIAWKKELEEFGYEREFEGYKAIVLHRNEGNSKVFESIWGKYDLYIMVSFNGDLWTVHLYSNPNVVKVNEIAMKYKGNGHPGASGFQCKTLPWKI